jgi:hypothetical protein
MKKRQSIRTAVILTQIKERFGNWPFDAIAVSCGTCREALAEELTIAVDGPDWLKESGAWLRKTSVCNLKMRCGTL